ncbi:MAG: Holliday junction resolvase RuvX [bacterium]|nr:Holliday junction resolvase RuvX [bacterium]
MTNRDSTLALDVGEKRIGVALATGGVSIAVPLEAVVVDGTEIDTIAKRVKSDAVNLIIVGYPRNQSGEATKQTAYVEAFVDRLESIGVPVTYQDESLTSVLAEQHLKQSGRGYQKGDIDSMAASIILQDYLENKHV